MVNPMSHVVRGADSRWPITAGKAAAAVAGDEGAANAQGDGTHRAADVERLGIAA